MRLHLLPCLFALLALNPVGWAIAEAPIGGSIAFILDCSMSMDQPAESGALVRQTSDAPPSTRMDAAQLMLRKMLRDLAADGTYNVGLWLYGHRLVWEPDVKHPDLLTQDTYLEATVGFAALNGLLPGDDVEQAQPIKRFVAQDHQALMMRLDVVKPWGEKPLYLTITRALDALADQPASAPKSIIVLTDGGNEQWLARFKTSSERVVGSLKQNITPVHFVCFGPRAEEDDPVEQELRELAEQSGGSVIHCTGEAQVTVAQVLSNSRKTSLVSSPLAGDDSDVESKISAAKAVLARAPDRTISGSVVFHGKPVGSATVTLEGPRIAPDKTDRQGRFLIRKVPSGRQYRVLVKGIALNAFREKTVDLAVEPDEDEQPFLTIDLK